MSSIDDWLKRGNGKILKRGAAYYRGFIRFKGPGSSSKFLKSISKNFPEAVGGTFRTGDGGELVDVDGTLRISGKKFKSMVDFISRKDIIDGSVDFSTSAAKFHEKSNTVRFGKTLAESRTPTVKSLRNPLDGFPVGTWVEHKGGWCTHSFARVVGKGRGKGVIVVTDNPPHEKIEGGVKYTIPTETVSKASDSERGIDAHARRGRDGVYLAFYGDQWSIVEAGTEVTCGERL